MAPELPRWLRIYDFASVEPARATIHYLEPPLGTRTLRVRWDDIERPEGFIDLAGGAVFARADGADRELSSEEDLGKSVIEPRPEGGRYLWREGVPWLEGVSAQHVDRAMLVLILPVGYSLDPKPVPRRAKEWKGRIAVFWNLGSDAVSDGAVEVSWNLVALEPDADLQQECDRIASLRWEQPAEEILGDGEAPAAGTRAAEPRSSRVVFGLHGIRTNAKWQKAFYEVAGRRGLKPSIYRWDFGYFSSARFLLPWERQKKLRWFRDTYDTEIRDRDVGVEEGRPPSIVAHSFGTYLVAYAVRRFENLKFDRVLLCGSILPTGFDWQRLIERGQIRRLRVEYGVRDPWVRLVGWLVAGAGPSGARGFSVDSPDIEQKKLEYDHSEYFSRGHMEESWVPFFRGHCATTEVTHPKPGPDRPWLAYLLSLVLVAALFGSVVAGIQLARRGSGAGSQPTDPPRSAVQPAERPVGGPVPVLELSYEGVEGAVVLTNRGQTDAEIQSLSVSVDGGPLRDAWSDAVWAESLCRVGIDWTRFGWRRIERGDPRTIRRSDPPDGVLWIEPGHGSSSTAEQLNAALASRLGFVVCSCSPEGECADPVSYKRVPDELPECRVAGKKAEPPRAAVSDSGLWSVDLEGRGGPAFGQREPLLMDGVERASGRGGAWNGFAVPGVDLPAGKGSLWLLDSECRSTGVRFEIIGDPVQGFSIGTGESTDLQRDYLFVGATTNSAASTTFEISGLQPNERYSMWLYSGANRPVVITVEGERVEVRAGGAEKVAGIRAGPDGKIDGLVEAPPGENSEGDWAGFQLSREAVAN